MTSQSRRDLRPAARVQGEDVINVDPEGSAIHFVFRDDRGVGRGEGDDRFINGVRRTSRREEGGGERLVNLKDLGRRAPGRTGRSA